MVTLFISDLHLSPKTPQLCQLFLDFLKYQAAKADALYILGDLFQAWLGEDDQVEFNNMIMAALYQQSSKGTALYWMPGNRDFLIDPVFFSQATGGHWLPDPSDITLYHRRVLLSHGDRFCTRDKAYQWFRTCARLPWVQWLFLKFPLGWRQQLARHLTRSMSTEDERWLIPDPKFDVVPQVVWKAMNADQCEVLIHGHTHQPGIQCVQTKSLPRQMQKRSCHEWMTRITLSDWVKQPHALVCDPQGGWALKYFTL